MHSTFTPNAFCVFFSILLFIASGIAGATDAAACSCGFYDPATQNIFTESTIIYFNETDHIPSEELVVQSFEHRYDRGWNTLYRKGASLSNVAIANDTSAGNVQNLALYCDPSTPEHLVEGASVRTARQDIFYGSFRTTMRSPRKWFPGSVLSMILDHNQTESWSVNLMNTNRQNYAWVSMLAKGVFPNLWLGVNYTTLQSEGMSPWYYTEYRVDWMPESIDYYIGGELQKSVTRLLNGTLPSTPSALQWQHWSTGDPYASQGPPVQRGEANLKDMRLFFNSSTMTASEHVAFDARCQPSLACSMDDWTLRGSSAYSEAATKKWVQQNPAGKTKWIPILVDAGFGFLSTILLAKTLSRRTSFSKLLNKLTGKSEKETKSEPESRAATPHSTEQYAFESMSGTSSPWPTSGISTPTLVAGSRTPWPPSGISTPTLAAGSRTAMPIYQSPNSTRQNLSEQLHRRLSSAGVKSQYDPVDTIIDSYHGPHSGAHSHINASDMDNPFLSDQEKSAIALSVAPNRQVGTSDPTQPTAPSKAVPNLPSASTELLSISEKNKSGVQLTVVAITPAGAKAATETTVIPTKRVDYLAGFIGISALLVTMNHFGLTFWAAVIIPTTSPHYPSEITARKTIASYFLDPLWIGPFLMISTRFLVSGYLRNGKLDAMAMKVTTRPFRLLIPVAFIALLEYFFMDLGAVTYLEYLPSVTWSDWPYTVIPTNLGTFISQVLQLAYLIPNSAPQITYYYCTGVLWTIPVQLQGAWQTVLAVIMVREIKTPWKRFSFYAFCIANHWYALSWGSYYYSGVLLADLDLTYKYTKFLHARPFVYYPLLIFVILVAQSGFTTDMIVQHTGVNYASYEYGWHPDVTTGLSISQAGRSTYPDYFIPRLNGLISTVFMQLIVEICPLVQKFLSLKPFQWIFPHIFTIYLIHGFIFWSIGSAACIGFFALGLPYWACVLLVFFVCYGTLLGVMPLLTPIIEIVGKNVTQSLWEHASQEPAPREKTLFPFGPEIFDEPAVGVPAMVEQSEKGPRIAVTSSAVETKDASRVAVRQI